MAKAKEFYFLFVAWRHTIDLVRIVIARQPHGADDHALQPLDAQLATKAHQGHAIFRCPHCEHRAIARSSRELTGTLREIIYICLGLNAGTPTWPI